MNRDERSEAIEAAARAVAKTDSSPGYWNERRDCMAKLRVALAAEIDDDEYDGDELTDAQKLAMAESALEQFLSEAQHREHELELEISRLKAAHSDSVVEVQKRYEARIAELEASIAATLGHCPSGNTHQPGLANPKHCLRCGGRLGTNSAFEE